MAEEESLKTSTMKREHPSEVADRIAEERSEDDGMPEHAAKARDPARWAAERRSRVLSALRTQRPAQLPSLGGTLVFATLTSLALVAAALVWLLPPRRSPVPVDHRSRRPAPLRPRG
jgi:hypothetical protein